MKTATTIKNFESPDECESAFYEAFRAGDLVAMRQIWGAGADIVCIHPARPPLSGRRAVMQSWVEILGATGGVDVRFDCRNRARADRLAAHFGLETIGTQDKEPSLVSVTNVYALTEDGWKLRAHHAGPIRRGASSQGPVH